MQLPSSGEIWLSSVRTRLMSVLSAFSGLVTFSSFQKVESRRRLETGSPRFAIRYSISASPFLDLLTM